MIIKKDDQYAVECQTKQAPDCSQHGDYCDTEEDAEEWVEFECWIDSGEGWICTRCNEYFLANIKVQRKTKGIKPANDLYKGIETVQ